eukprot:2249350-Prymnesium_polylepis.1
MACGGGAGARGGMAGRSADATQGRPRRVPCLGRPPRRLNLTSGTRPYRAPISCAGNGPAAGERTPPGSSCTISSRLLWRNWSESRKRSAGEPALRTEPTPTVGGGSSTGAAERGAFGSRWTRTHSRSMRSARAPSVRRTCAVAEWGG